MIGEKQSMIAGLWVVGSVWVQFVLSAHTRPIYPTYFAGNWYTPRITTIITLSNNFIGSSCISKNVTYIKLCSGSVISVVCVFLFKVYI